MDPYREPVEEKVEEKKDNSAPEQRILAAGQKVAEQPPFPPQPEKIKTLEQVLSQEKPTQLSPPPAPSPLREAKEDKSPSAKNDTERIKALEKNQQIKALVDLAFQKGVSYAVEIVRTLNNPYLLDEFHDVLVDKFRQELIEKGKLEEI